MSKFSNVWVWFAELIDKSGSRFDVSQAARKIADSPLADNRFVQVKEITSTDSPYTVTDDDVLIDADPVGGAITVNLPAGIDKRRYVIKNAASSGANQVTIVPNGSETIELAANSVLNASPTRDSNSIYFVDSAKDWRIE